MKNTFKPLLVLPMGLVLSACVTINIYFPAAAAEKAADRIIEEVWQIEDATRDENKSQKPGKLMEGIRP
ncbi:MAG: hypothetical protein WAT53_08590 [Nitrosomonas sp.]|jgi:hypothetical protein|nr:hypothetical protein [Nitrosomonas sp.]MCC7136622.1 hypothetical protein [Nitrosomonas sp.]